jgi:CsoR family transcriptional regulator, copper-sensing transcriptional repressor
LQTETKHELLHRLRSEEGHVLRIAKMVEEDAYSYADIVQQTRAVVSAIKRVNTLLLEDVVEERVRSEAERDGIGASEELLQDLIKVINRAMS